MRRDKGKCEMCADPAHDEVRLRKGHELIRIQVCKRHFKKLMDKKHRHAI